MGAEEWDLLQQKLDLHDVASASRCLTQKASASVCFVLCWGGSSVNAIEMADSRRWVTA